jgi:hypothetical protein
MENNGASLSQTTGSAPEGPPEMGKQPIDRIHEDIFPDQRRHGGHDEKRCDHQNAHNALPPHGLVKEHRQQHAQERW